MTNMPINIIIFFMYHTTSIILPLFLHKVQEEVKDLSYVLAQDDSYLQLNSISYAVTKHDHMLLRTVCHFAYFETKTRQPRQAANK
jgi:hypothetical protein